MADMDHSGSGFNRGSTYAYPAPIHRPIVFILRTLYMGGITTWILMKTS